MRSEKNCTMPETFQGGDALDKIISITVGYNIADCKPKHTMHHVMVDNLNMCILLPLCCLLITGSALCWTLQSRVMYTLDSLLLKENLGKHLLAMFMVNASCIVDNARC